MNNNVKNDQSNNHTTNDADLANFDFDDCPEFSKTTRIPKKLNYKLKSYLDSNNHNKK